MSHQTLDLNLTQTYGPTLTLKELCKLMKISRSVYYSSINSKSPTYKEDFPLPLAGFRKNLFMTKQIENYLDKLSFIKSI
jgi:predicted DNA-binding transcriptional regulator AlpA